MVKKIILRAAVSFMFFGLLLGISYADQLTLQPGPEDSKDNMIANGSYSDMNFGAPRYNFLDIFRIYNFEGRGLIQFNIPLNQNGISLENATLSLFMAGYSLSPSAVYANLITADWDKNTVTWNNQPAYTDLLQASSGLLDSSRMYTWVSFDITQISSYWLLHPDENYGVMLITDNPSHYAREGFFSSEYNNASWRPKLVLNYNVVPEPVSMLLFGIGSLTLTLAKRANRGFREHNT